MWTRTKRRKELEEENESGDGVIFKMKRDPRITLCGRFIRKYSIDELPQIFNVLLGGYEPRRAAPSPAAGG